MLFRSDLPCRPIIPCCAIHAKPPDAKRRTTRTSPSACTWRCGRISTARGRRLTKTTASSSLPACRSPRRRARLDQYLLRQGVATAATTVHPGGGATAKTWVRTGGRRRHLPALPGQRARPGRPAHADGQTRPAGADAPDQRRLRHHLHGRSGRSPPHRHPHRRVPGPAPPGRCRGQSRRAAGPRTGSAPPRRPRQRPPRSAPDR